MMEIIHRRRKMSFVSTKCSQCGGDLIVDAGKKTAVCPYCGTSFMISNPEVHIHNGQSKEEKLRNAETFLTVHQDFKKAYTIFEQIANEFPDDYRGWWGMVRASTGKFQCTDYDLVQQNESIVKHAKNVASEEMKTQINATWQEYYNRCNEEARRKRERREEEIRLEWEEKRLEQEKYDSLCSERNRLSDLSNYLWIGSKILLVIGIIIILLSLWVESFANIGAISLIFIAISIFLAIKQKKSDREWQILDKEIKKRKTN